ncbi:isocitrate lyase/PEP mutase family protein [Saccharopolyspora dendranthemae]|uniref:2-methylisocitrate lyase n=1 Tax=Saccharopolyspora dendranthemae TaxID=1181886 RepID=A0A561U8B3_9PSEU|nr:oxaloacetate decarboxylase [Saccharopolyspora dendranthemae]TWF95608.1 2,3-dimethylmalate lyase [Saccharopolyspora dendranthemae]
MGDLLGSSGEPRARLRALLREERPVVAPGAYDALSAALVERAGFSAVYMTGFGTTASLIGRPDVGLLTATEMIDQASRISAAVDVPVIADADTGYGNAVNVARTVRGYERAGAAAIHLEDQVFPKKCGHMGGKAVIPAQEMAGKVRAAVAARTDPDFLLIARTDAAAVHGLDDALERAKAYADAGADLLFVEAPTDERSIVRISEELAGAAPLVFNWVEGGRTPPIPLDRIAELGFALVLFPIGTLLAATAGIRSLLESVRNDGTPAAAMSELPTFAEFTDLVGMAEIQDLQQRFGSD